MTVLAKPAFKVTHGGGSSCVSLYSRLRKEGIDIVEWAPWRMLAGRYDILHLHWPDNIISTSNACIVVIKMVTLWLALCWVRLRGARIVWTAHNLQAHEMLHPRLERCFWKWFPRKLDAVIAPMRFIAERLKQDKRFQGVRLIESCPFGSWNDFYTARNGGKERLIKRYGLDLSRPVILWLGHVRRYKGVDRLLNVFKDAHLAKVQLVIAGNCNDSGYADILRDLSVGMNNVSLHLGFVPDEDVADHFALADVSVFPFKEVTNTGSVRLALTFNVHVLVPNLPFACELRSVLGDEWLTTYDHEQEMTAVDVSEALIRAKAVTGRTVNWGSYNWDFSARKTVSLYNQIINKA